MNILLLLFYLFMFILFIVLLVLLRHVCYCDACKCLYGLGICVWFYPNKLTICQTIYKQSQNDEGTAYSFLNA